MVTIPKLTFWQQIRSFPSSFWVANSIELVERFSFFGVRTIAALYIVAEAEKGGLEFTNTDKGIFFGVWSLIQCLLPMFTGGFADRYGYRISLIVAFLINIVGYSMMGFTTSWWSFMAACCMIGTGTAIFKPPLHGTLAHCVNESNSSVGWGMFYQVVNIGGFIGPVICGYLRLLEWRYAFFAAASIIIVNIMITLLFLKDYAKGRDSADSKDQKKNKNAAQVFAESMAILADLRFVVFLAIFSGFWFMFMQLFDQLSIFIDQWVDSSDIMKTVASLFGSETLAQKAAEGVQVNAEWIVNVDAGSIILLVLLISYITSKFRPISAMIFGMAICCVGLAMAGSFTSGWMCVISIMIFAVGEMACSPKFSEYVGLMAPPEKKALYMGYSNIPFAVGWSGTNFIGAPLYQWLSDKDSLARRYLIDELNQSAGSVEKLSKSEVTTTLCEKLGQGEAAVREMLWNHYQPQTFWYICMAIGVAATIAMIGYHFWLEADAKKRAAA